MNKKSYKYHLTLQGVKDAYGEPLNNSLGFEFENHDDLFKIIDMATSRPVFEKQSDNLEFFVGLKLLSEVLLRNRQESNALTSEMYEAVGSFMKKLKSR